MFPSLRWSKFIYRTPNLESRYKNYCFKKIHTCINQLGVCLLQLWAVKKNLWTVRYRKASINYVLWKVCKLFGLNNMKPTISLEIAIKCLFISTNLQNQKAKCQKQSPRCCKNYIMWKHLLLEIASDSARLVSFLLFWQHKHFLEAIPYTT